MDAGKATLQIIKVLPHRSRVALACAVTEHLVDLYRSGNIKHTTRAVPALASAAPERDLIDLALEHAWRFVQSGEVDREVTQAIIDVLDAQPFVEASSTTHSAPATGPIYGALETLKALTDPTHKAAGFAASRSKTGVSFLVAAFDPTDEDAPARERNLEADWQLKVATALQQHGDHAIDREVLAPLLREELPWRRHLAAYRAKWA